MKIETFTLGSTSVGGIATLREAHASCGGQNISPQLHWTHAPEDTQSFAVTMYDKDAPTGSGFWHWVIFDIPAIVTDLREDAGNTFGHIAPQIAVQSLNDYGTHGYGGPKPPHGHGWHCYMITVHALCVRSLGLSKDTLPAQVGFRLWQNTIEKASIVFYYKN